jgi:hypothetical protein
MSDEWSPDSILTNEKFTENNVVEIREIFDMIDIRFSFEVKENNDRFDYDIIRHCNFSAFTEHSEYTIRVIIGADFHPTPMDEALFYGQLKKYLGQDDSSGRDDFIRESIIYSHWKLDRVWEELRKLKQDGIEIIETVKSYFKERLPSDQIPLYLSNYIESQYINLKGKSESYFEYSPLLMTFKTKFSGIDYPDFDCDKFIKHFEEIMDESLRDILSNRKFSELELYIRKMKGKVPDLSRGAGWKLDGDRFVGDYRMLTFEVIYLSLIKSNHLELLPLFEKLIGVIINPLH